MNSFSKTQLTLAITIALSGAVLSSSANAGWWGGFNKTGDATATEQTKQWNWWNGFKAVPENSSANEATKAEDADDKATPKVAENIAAPEETATPNVAENTATPEEVVAPKVEVASEKKTDAVALSADTKKATKKWNWWNGFKSTESLPAKTSVETAVVEHATTPKVEEAISNQKAETVVAENSATVADADVKKANKTNSWWNGFNAGAGNSPSQAAAGGWWAGFNKNTNTSPVSVATKVTATAHNTVAKAEVASNEKVTKRNTWWNGFDNGGAGNTQLRAGNWWSGYNQSDNAVKKVAQASDNANIVTYTISGTTSRSNVEKLLALVKNNENISMVTNSQPATGNNARQNQQQRGYYYNQRPVFIQSTRNPYIWYRAPMFAQPQQKQPKK